jgi:carbonic anhydrase
MKSIGKFITGFKHFQSEYFSNDRQLFDSLVAKGQHPRAMVVACSDSRVDPAMLTASRPGDMFVIRNIANLIPPYNPASPYPGVSAALEYGVCQLEVEHIIVLGHAHCGGIQSLMRGNGAQKCGEFISRWTAIAERARERVCNELPDKPPEVQARACEQASILVSLENLMTFPWIRERVEHGRMALHGWYFDIERGELLRYDPYVGRFEPLE